MIWETKFTKMTGAKYPIIMAAFARWGTIDFAAAFSNTGGFGIVTSQNIPLKNFKSEIQRMKSLTDLPFGINISIFKERQTDMETYLKYVEIALEEGVRVFTTSAYQAPLIGKRVHESGGIWIQKCPLIRHAISAEKAGADAVTLMGLESSGVKNPYQHTTLVNLSIGRQLLSVPIIAAGGIGDARTMLGSLMLGADAVCLGSVILATEESPYPRARKEAWIKTDILTEDYHKQLYHMKLMGTRVASPSIYFIRKIKPLNEFVSDLINKAEKILENSGFIGDKFKTI